MVGVEKHPWASFELLSLQGWGYLVPPRNAGVDDSVRGNPGEAPLAADYLALCPGVSPPLNPPSGTSGLRSGRGRKGPGDLPSKGKRTSLPLHPRLA